MAFGKSGDKPIQLLASVAGVYVAYVGYTINDPLLMLIGVCTMVYDFYIFVCEKPLPAEQ